jgi:polyisoprenoid-binding protein YceI
LTLWNSRGRRSGSGRRSPRFDPKQIDKLREEEAVMTFRRFALGAVALLASLALPAAAEVSRWEVDVAHSNVGFSIRHFLTQVPGEFQDFSGAIAYDAANPAASSVEVTVQAASIDTDHDDRDNHLRSPDFFDVAQHPTLSFKSTAVKALDGDTLEVTGDFTLHGVTQRITVPVEVLGVMGKKAGFSTAFTIDRQAYGVKWNRALDTGGAILGDEVRIAIDVEANLAEPAAPAGG